jgi:hypothetical protein
MTSDSGYINFWKIEKPKVEETPRFTDMELALMEGGHSIGKEDDKFQFLKQLKNTP